MSDPLLLLIETSTEVCSVALCKGVNIIAFRVINEPKSHARIIAVMVEEVLNQGGISISNCDAVVVSEGPGSYTGLRVGVSIAKGLCYGASIPLIAVSSLELLAQLAIHTLAAGENHSLAAGENHTLAAGENHTFAAGENHSLAAGENNTLAAGENHSLAAGENNTLAAGDTHTFAAGENHTLAAGENHTLAAGENLAQPTTISPGTIIIPMIDARRMEVYTAKFDSLCNPLSKTEAVILDQNSFSDELSKGDVIFAGVGAEKFKSIINNPINTNNNPNSTNNNPNSTNNNPNSTNNNPNSTNNKYNVKFVIIGADARGMVIPALKKFKSSDFVDVAYFEPFYLKDFIAGVTKKRLL